MSLKIVWFGTSLNLISIRVILKTKLENVQVGICLFCKKNRMMKRKLCRPCLNGPKKITLPTAEYNVKFDCKELTMKDSYRRQQVLVNWYKTSCNSYL